MNYQRTWRSKTVIQKGHTIQMKPSDSKSIQTEIDAMKALGLNDENPHPNFPKYYGSHQAESGYWYLVMERVDGMELGEALYVRNKAKEGNRSSQTADASQHRHSRPRHLSSRTPCGV